MGRRRLLVACVVGVVSVACWEGDALAAATTVRVSVSSLAAQGNGESSNPAVSANGRFVAFASRASNLVAGDTNGAWDVFVRDLVAGTTSRVSVSSKEHQSNGPSGFVRRLPQRRCCSSATLVAISADGRFVAFMSRASNLVAGDSNRVADVFIRDRARGVTHRVSVATGGRQADRASVDLDLSATGDTVAFSTRATNLLRKPDSGGLLDVFERDLSAGKTRRVDLGSQGHPARADCFAPTISRHGGRVAFLCEQGAFPSDLLVVPDTPHYDVWYRNRISGTTTQVNVSQRGELAGTSGDVGPVEPSLSDDGHFVVFSAPGRSGLYQVWVRNPARSFSKLGSVGAGGGEGNGESFHPTISRSGRYVAFASCADNLIAGDSTGAMGLDCETPVDIFRRDRTTKTTTRIDLTTGGLAPTTGTNDLPVLSGAGTWITFVSTATDLTNTDTNNQADIFARGPLP